MLFPQCWHDLSRLCDILLMLTICAAVRMCCVTLCTVLILYLYQLVTATPFQGWEGGRFQAVGLTDATTTVCRFSCSGSLYQSGIEPAVIDRLRDHHHPIIQIR